MNFNHLGYSLVFIQKEKCRDIEATSHIETFIYKFFSPVTKLNYIIRTERHQYDVFVVKFYAQCHSSHKYKYSLIINKGDFPNIIVTCCKVVPTLLSQFPNASFCFMGGRSIDKKTKRKRAEKLKNNQRFRIYRNIAALKFGTQTFTHFEYTNASSYLLINNKYDDIDFMETKIKNMLFETYPDLETTL